MSKRLEILLVDQDQEVRYGIRKLLARSEVTIAGEASFGTEALNRAVRLQPDVILCALEEPLVRPLATMEALLNALPATPIVAYSRQEDIQIVRKAMLAGARDFLVRPFSADALESAALAVLGSEEEKRFRLSGYRRGIGFRGTMVSVFSAKGGVGKTTFAANLVAALAQGGGQSVALVDADTSFGDVMTAMDLEASADLYDLLQEMASNPEPDLSRYLVTHSSGAHILPPPRNPLDWSQVEPERLQTVLEYLGRSHDYVIVDLSPALAPITLAALEDASLILWLLSPEICSLRDNLEALELVQDRGISMDKVRLVLNYPHAATADISAKGIEAAMDAPLYWTIPHDRDLYRRSQLGQAGIGPGKVGPGGQGIVSLARALAGVSSNGNSGPSKRPLHWLGALPRIRHSQEVA